MPEQESVYISRCNDAGDDVACVAYGAVLENGYGEVEEDPKAAFEHFATACKAGVQLACHKAADYYRSGAAVKQDHQQATRLYEGACDEGFASACQLLGIVNIQSKGERRDVEAGFAYIHRACEAGRGASCRSLEYACYQGQRAACEYTD